MTTFHVAETFTSINGEGTHAGQLAVFVRFCGCNFELFVLRHHLGERAGCAVCLSDHRGNLCIRRCRWRTQRHTDRRRTVLRGGMTELLTALSQKENRYIEIETNGSVDLTPFVGISPSIAFTMDYKLPGSGMEAHMRTENFALLRAQDTVKFVAGSQEDLQRALEVIRTYDLTHRCHVYLSPVFGSIEPAEIVDFMQAHTLNDVTLQLQMHKFIWDPNKRGV